MLIFGFHFCDKKIFQISNICAGENFLLHRLILFNSQSLPKPCLSLPSTNLSSFVHGGYVLYILNLHFFEERQGIYTIHACPWFKVDLSKSASKYIISSFLQFSHWVSHWLKSDQWWPQTCQPCFWQIIRPKQGWPNESEMGQFLTQL